MNIYKKVTEVFTVETSREELCWILNWLQNPLPGELEDEETNTRKVRMELFTTIHAALK